MGGLPGQDRGGDNFQIVHPEDLRFHFFAPLLDATLPT